MLLRRGNAGPTTAAGPFPRSECLRHRVAEVQRISGPMFPCARWLIFRGCLGEPWAAPALPVPTMAKLHDRMFIAQTTLEAWLDTGNVEVRENLVHLRKLARTYLLEPAVRFVSVVPEGSAPTLIGKVLTERRILDLGGELLGNSVLFGESAFVVEPGYVGTLDGPGLQAASSGRKVPG